MDFRQQPLLLQVQFGGNFLQALKNIFKLRKLRTAFNSLPGHQFTQRRPP